MSETRWTRDSAGYIIDATAIPVVGGMTDGRGDENTRAAPLYASTYPCGTVVVCCQGYGQGNGIRIFDLDEFICLLAELREEARERFGDDWGRKEPQSGATNGKD